MMGTSKGRLAPGKRRKGSKKGEIEANEALATVFLQMLYISSGTADSNL